MSHEKCGRVGTHTGAVPMPISGRVRYIDPCIADIVAALNAANVVTVSSCCGHGVLHGDITLEDGRVLTVTFPGDTIA